MTRGAGQDLGACAAVDARVSVFCASESGVKVWLLSKSVTTLSRHWPGKCQKTALASCVQHCGGGVRRAGRRRENTTPLALLTRV